MFSLMSNSYCVCRLLGTVEAYLTLMDLLYAVCTNPVKHKVRLCILLHLYFKRYLNTFVKTETLKVHVRLLKSLGSRSFNNKF